MFSIGKSSIRLCSAFAIATTLFASGVDAAGDPAAGKAAYAARCAACHSMDYNGTGPAHRGVFGRKAGAAPGFAYSAALARAKVVWSEGTLDRWLTNPEKFLPGQKMGVSVPEAKLRADLIAYLKSESTQPRE